MSRSYQRHKIAWGRATEGGASRCKTSYSDDLVKKNRKKYGKILIRKRHWRSDLQTVEDYIQWLKHLFDRSVKLADCRWSSSFHEKRTLNNFLTFLDGREPTEELFKEFATRLYKRDRSK